MPKLAVIILTKNEEANIEAAMDSATFADEILIIDSGSTDRTQELAEKHGAKFISHPMDEEGFAGQRNFALTQTDAEWVFYLDADERIMPNVVEKIKCIVKNDEQAAYRVERKNVVFGKLMGYGVNRPDYVTRFFPRERIKWRGTVHEGIDTDLSVRKINGCLKHYTYVTWEQYFTKFNRYTTLAAKEMAGKGKTISCAAILSHVFFSFFKSYIWKQGFRDGFLGFVMTFMSMAYVMTKYMKLKNIEAEENYKRSR